MRRVAALCVESDSVYKELEGVECWDKSRDAWTYREVMPVLTHPPCRLFGRLHWKVTAGELEVCREILLGLWCVGQVQRCGGVLEQPAHSRLFSLLDLPHVEVSQFWWGHRSEKPTWLYFVGCGPVSMPPRVSRYTGGGAGGPGSCARLCSRERQRTPRRFAEWLVECVRGVAL